MVNRGNPLRYRYSEIMSRPTGPAADDRLSRGKISWILAHRQT
jgi:hypothetical protein